MQDWYRFLDTLTKRLGDDSVNAWLRPLKIVHFDACNLYLEASNIFFVDWFEEHIRPKLAKEFCNSNGRCIKIHLTSTELPPAPARKEKTEVSQTTPPPFVPLTDPILPEYTAENFIFSEENQILYELMEKVKEETILFSPILLYGAPCSGKTHILQAFYNEYKKQKKEVLYVHVETFMENLVKGIRSGQMQEFRKSYRHIDVLIVDDIQHLAKKWATQEEFFHTFNTLHSSGRQIILSSSLPPSSLQEIEPRLISRFEWGLSLPIVKLQGKDLFTLIHNQVDRMHLPLREDCLPFLMETFSGNIRSLQKSLAALCLRIPQHTSLLSPNDIERLLSDLIAQESKNSLSPERIVSFVAEIHKIDPKEIIGKSQTQEFTTPRQIAMFLCRKELQMPYIKIGDFFGRDHSTVMSSVKSIEEKINKGDKALLSLLALIKQKEESLLT